MNFENYPNFQWFIFVFSLFVLNDLHHPFNQTDPKTNRDWVTCISPFYKPFCLRLPLVLIGSIPNTAVSIGPSNSFGVFPSLTWEAVFTY